MAAARCRARGDAPRARLWTLTTVAHTVPFFVAALVLFMLQPVSVPVAVILLVHAWTIPSSTPSAAPTSLQAPPRGRPSPEGTALGLLGDLVGHGAREVDAAHRARPSPAGWAPGSSGRRAPSSCGRAAGARLLVRPGRRPRCRRRTGSPTPARAARGRAGFATVANRAFAAPRGSAGASRPLRPALVAARRLDHRSNRDTLNFIH